MNCSYPLSIFVLGLSLFVGMVPRAESTDAGTIIANVIVEAIRPGFANLSDSADVAHSRISALCDEPGEASLMDARSAFHQLVESWGRIEFVSLGPLSSNNRKERMLFWPDRRGRGLMQVRNVIRTQDTSAIDVATLAQKSVAVQGLLALEFTLFGSGAEVLMDNKDSSRCAYADAISSNIANIAEEAEALWMRNDPKSIAYVWQNPSPNNPLFRDGREQLTALFKIVGDGFEIIQVQRLDPFLRDGFEQARPKSALFWRSGNTVRSAQANINGLEDLMVAAGLENVVVGSDKRLVGSLFFEFANANSALAAVGVPADQIARNEADYGKLNYARIVVNSLNTLLREQLLPVFNLSTGFSSLDGD